MPEESAGKATELVMMRKGMLQVMEPKGDLQHMEFRIPSRGLIGLRNQILTATSGEAIMTHRFESYDAYAGDISTRSTGSLVSSELGKARAYEIDRLQERGTFFIDPGDEIYPGQVVGESARNIDMEINLVRGKKLTNMRALVQIRTKNRSSKELSLEGMGGLLIMVPEVTPKSLRVRKIPGTRIP